MYQRILVPLDGSVTAERGLHEAIGLAAALKARLYLLNVVNEFPLYMEMASAASFDETMNLMRQRGEDMLAQAKNAAIDTGVPDAVMLFREVVQGSVADVIIEEANKHDCNLIVMGTHGRRGLSRLTMGSNAELVVRGSPVPVLLVRQEEPKS